MLSVAASYVENLEAVLIELRRHMSPNAVISMSVLSRWSLRRILRLRFGRNEYYRTRGDKSEAAPPRVTTYSRSELQRLSVLTGFRLLSMHGTSPLAGVLEAGLLWELGQWLGRAAPWSGHSQEVIMQVAP